MFIIKELLFFLFFFSALTSPALAEVVNENNLPRCQPIYGGGPTCIQSENISINKTIQNPQTLQFEENLDINGPKYYPGQIVQFRIEVQNTSDTEIKNIKIKDSLPKYLNCLSGENQKCDKSAKTISLSLDKLNPDEAKTIILKAAIASEDQFSDNQKNICLINQINATLGNEISQDNSQFCIQKTTSLDQNTNSNKTKGGLPVYPPSKAESTPKTGPESLALFGLMASGLIGFILNKKTQYKK